MNTQLGYEAVESASPADFEIGGSTSKDAARSALRSVLREIAAEVHDATAELDRHPEAGIWLVIVTARSMTSVQFARYTEAFVRGRAGR